MPTPSDPDPRVEGSSEPSVSTVGPWRILRWLGGGGMGTVWLAERADGAFRMQAAVKLVNRDRVRAEDLERFVRERQILADLQHPHICRLLDGGTTPDGRPYLVMELVHGHQLDRHCAERRLPMDALMALLAKVCDALAFAHARNIVHRDLKPSNIMVSPSGEPKVLDFGIARLAGAGEDMTQTGQVVMTAHYASPEQWKHNVVGPASDIFSLGVILFELLSGRREPAPGFTGLPLETLTSAGVSDALREIVQQATAERPEDRFPSMTAFAEALRSRGHTHTFAAGRPRVFISCRSDVAEDLTLAVSLYDALAEAGASACLAATQVAVDADWVGAVTRAITRSDVVLLLLSSQSVVSEVVAHEIRLARALSGEQGGRPRIQPVWIEHARELTPTSPLYEYTEGLTFVVWRDVSDTDGLVRQIVDANVVGVDPRSTRGRASAPAEALRRNVLVSSTLDTHSGSLPLPGGVVEPHSPYYVRPAIEDQCFREILKPGGLIRIKGSRQMGKTSLMRRVLDHAAQTQVRPVAINLGLTDSATLADLDRLLRWLCVMVSRRLGMTIGSIDRDWDDVFGPKGNCTDVFERTLLPACPAGMVLAIDHLDRVFEHPATAEEFLSLLRAWNEMARSERPWQQLRMVLVYATEMYLPMNVNHSPFNIGLPVALAEWNRDIVGKLAEQHGLPLTETDLDQLMRALHGHPHLVRVALYHLATGKSLEAVLGDAATDQGLFADHLKSLLWHLQAQPELAEAATQVMNATGPVRLPTELAFKLASLGLVHLQGNEVHLARALYRDYLADRLVSARPT